MCICCATDLPPPANGDGRSNRETTIEHVLPKSPRTCDLPRIKKIRALIGKHAPRKAAAHAKCNRRKSNRLPTGCEIVFLMAINVRLYAVEQARIDAEKAAYAPTKAENRRAKKQRNRENRRARELARIMQAELSA